MSGSKDNYARIWDLRSRVVVFQWSSWHKGVWSCRFIPEKQYIVTGGGDGMVHVWPHVVQMQQKQPLTAVNAHPGRVLTMSHMADMLVTSGADGNVKLWSLHSGTNLGTIKSHKNWVKGLATDLENEWLFTAGHDMDICMWTTPPSPNNSTTGLTQGSMRPTISKDAISMLRIRENQVELWKNKYYKLMDALATKLDPEARAELVHAV
eukprot:TRINITY_DN67746_c0_g1_i1.p1 TRINITY_DN67746_c0_g1~~TRINITY_DN67746_c0_g1_i1.p1  ORF type:complete len:208 (+),score=23.04 TRINITY_DN67746_c0_g1_i1:2-625(+)